ncbi:putative inner membrane protein [Halalkalicoccus paucihalophilus]|uniref:Putative inner membrane protein n=1 Tax=Halalkalicoccus paucihalophilus TaxID=1008153 RepID=A0A151AIY3_9EURY|nr:AI-2E family transporter [Halalkalicoccus paucihalophilus]KYH27367.1 putative inner membrane protein [Halalkalicoccus paucihalophilus]
MSTRSERSRTFLIIVGIGVGILSSLIVLPFLSWILIAVVLAYVLRPIDDRLSKRLGPGLSAGLSILGGLFLVVLPILVILGVAANQARQLAVDFDLDDVSQIDAVIAEWLGVQVDTATVHDAFSGAVKTGARGLIGNLFSIIGGLPELFLGFTVLFFVLFYLLKDGESAVEWLRRVLPIEPDVREELFEETGLLLYNSLVGTAVVAGAQAVLLGVVFVVLGLGNVVFWIVTTFIAAMIPLLGASIVWIPASIYLLVVGRPLSAIALFVFGALVISTVDNLLRPMVMRRGTQLSPVLTIIGIFGGIALFGFVGLFIGPIVLGITKLLIELLVREYPESTPVEGR